jgi:hypothetical protein
MPLYLITNTELDDICYYLTQTDYIYYPETNEYLTDLYNTGARPAEMFSVNLWLYISPTSIRLQPLKGNDQRFFSASDLTANFVSSIINQIKPYNGLTQRQLSSVLKKIFPYTGIQTVGKSAIEYIFRYNYVKKLHDSGMSDTDICTIMGWQYLAQASVYYLKQIFAENTSPPIYTHYIVDADNSIILDSATNKLVD